MSNALATLTALRTAALVGAAKSEVTLQQVQEVTAQQVIVGPFAIPLSEPLAVKAIKRTAGEDGTREATVKFAHSIEFSGVEGLKRGKLTAPVMETQVFAQLLDEAGEVFGMVSISKGFRDGNRQTDTADNMALAVVHSRQNEWTLPSRQASGNRTEPKVDAVQEATALLNQRGALPLGIYIDETPEGNPGLSEVIEDALLATTGITLDGVVAHQALLDVMRVLPKPVAQAASRPGATIADNTKKAPTAGTDMEVAD